MIEKCLVINTDNKIHIYQNCNNTFIAESKVFLFATPLKTPEGIHTYEINEDSLWSAAALGLDSIYIRNTFEEFSRNTTPKAVLNYIEEKIKEFWTVELFISKSLKLIGNYEIINKIEKSLIEHKNKYEKVRSNIIKLEMTSLNTLKPILIDLNIFIIEKYSDLHEDALDYKVNVDLYKYQEIALNSILKERIGKVKARGIITMPPGSGKTIIGLKLIEKLKIKTLVIVENNHSRQSWENEILAKTTLKRDNIGVNEDNGQFINIYTYKKAISLLDPRYQEKWGLIIYDDAWKLATQENQQTAYITSPYKLAMGSFLERDGNENKIYRAIGARLFNITLNEMEEKYGQIPVKCYLVLIPNKNTFSSNKKNAFEKTAIENIYTKLEAINVLENEHKGKKLVVSHFKEVANKLSEFYPGSEVITGSTKIDDINEIIKRFNNDSLHKIFATQIIEKLQLREIEVVITTSLRGNSPKDEYMRIGKLKSSNPLFSDMKGYYYSLIIQSTKEEAKFRKTMKTMILLGYKYHIRNIYDLRDIYEH